MELNPCDRLNQPTKRSGVKIIPKNVLDADLVTYARWNSMPPLAEDHTVSLE